MPRKPLVTRFHLLLLGLLVAVTATAFVKIPADAALPVHWGLDGHPDQVWPRIPALLMFPLIGAVITGLFLAIGRFTPPELVEPGRSISETVLAGVLLLFCALQFAMILIGVGSDIDMVRFIAFGLAALSIITGLSLPQSQPNVFAGIRLPWTMADPGNWRATHRLTGGLMVLGGLGLAAVAWLWPDPVDMMLAMAAALLLPVIIGGIYSFARARGGRRDTAPR